MHPGLLAFKAIMTPLRNGEIGFPERFIELDPIDVPAPAEAPLPGFEPEAVPA